MKFKKRLIPTLLVGALAISAATPSAFAQLAGTDGTSGSSGTTQTVLTPAISLTNRTGILWLGNAMNASINAFQGADRIQWTLYSRTQNTNEPLVEPFTQVDQQTLKIGTPYPVSTWATQPKSQYKLVATYLKGDLSIATAPDATFKVLELPVVSSVVVPKIVGANAGAKTVSFKLQSNDIKGPVTVAFGDKMDPVVASAEPTTDSDATIRQYMVSVPIPTTTGQYQFRVNVPQSLDVVSKPATSTTIGVVTGPKVTASIAPKLVDPTAGAATTPISIRAANSVSEVILPSTVVDPSTKKKVSLFKALWTTPDNPQGTLLSADTAYGLTVTPQRYAALRDALLSEGKTGPVIYPVSVKVYHPDYEAETTTIQTFNLKVGVPWVMPEWAVSPTKPIATAVVAPSTITIQATPSVAFDRTAAKTHKLTYTWSIPEQLVAKGSGDKVTLQLNQAGKYPLAFKATDDLGNIAIANYEVSAIPPTLTITDAVLRAVPASGRFPVTVTSKVATTSTHERERPNAYEIYDGGRRVYSGATLKPIILTTPGLHKIKIVAKSAFGSSAEKTVQQLVIDNRKPVCNPLKSILTTLKTTGVVTGASLTAQCSDPDGKVKSYVWSINGNTVNSTTNRVSYAFGQCETSAEVSLVVTDDSDESSVFTETVQRGGVNSCSTTGI